MTCTADLPETVTSMISFAISAIQDSFLRQDNLSSTVILVFTVTALPLHDWHENDPSHRLHGFTHPKRALINATADWNLSDRTQNIILRHMFPLTPVPPACREAWLVCLADKVCALAETFHMTEQFFASIKYPYDIKNPRPW